MFDCWNVGRGELDFLSREEVGVALERLELVVESVVGEEALHLATSVLR